MSNFLKKYISGTNSALVKNSAWGLTGSIVQNIFLSLFYVLVARHFSVDDFAQYIIANSLYQVIVAFSAMGLGQWFIREVVGTPDKNSLVRKFLKMQACFGIFFFVINVVIALTLYDEFTVRILSLLFAVNIILDNIIYSIKHVNIAEFAQKKTVSVLSIEAFAKFGIACLLFVFPFSIVWLAILLVGIRLVTLNLFLRIGAAEGIELTGFWKAEISWSYIKSILGNNWAFAVIGSAYIIYWKIATIIISKMLSLQDVAHYENSFKVFSLAQLVPIVVTASILPKLVELYKNKQHTELKSLYKKVFLLYMLYGIGAFTFTYTFADELIPMIFGEKYVATALYTKEMFLTMLVLPTASLQAQVLIAMKLEKLDMWFNINSVFINAIICVIGIWLYNSLSVVNYAIFVSYIIFHLSQDFILVKKKFITIKEVFMFIFFSLAMVGSYVWLSDFSNDYLLFGLYWLVILTICYIGNRKFKTI